MSRKCPLCGQPLELLDSDFNFEGNEDIWYSCNHCHTSFKYYIRYHNVWKYRVTNQYLADDGEWYDDEDSTYTVYVFKKGCKK